MATMNGGKSSEVLEELVREWRTNPDAESTISLCSYLSATHGDIDIVDEVAGAAVQRHADNADAMLSVARMFLAAARWADAERILTDLAKRDATDARVLYYLGQVTLLGGRARRAEELLSSALEHGAAPDAREWLDRARGYVELERSAGPAAVANDARAAFIATLPSARHSSGIRHIESVDPTAEDTWRPASRSLKAAAAVPRPSSKPVQQLALLKPPKPSRAQASPQSASPQPASPQPAMPQSASPSAQAPSAPPVNAQPIGPQSPSAQPIGPQSPSAQPVSASPSAQPVSASPSASTAASGVPPATPGAPPTGAERKESSAAATVGGESTNTAAAKAPRTVIVPVLAPETPKQRPLADRPPVEHVNEEVTRIMSQPALREYQRRSSLPHDEPTQEARPGHDAKVPDEPTRVIRRPGDPTVSDQQIDEPTRVMKRSSDPAPGGFAPHEAPRRLLGQEPSGAEPTDDDVTAIYGLGRGNEEVTVTQTAIIHGTGGHFEIETASSTTPSGMSFHVPKLGRMLAGQRRRRALGRGASATLLVAVLAGGGFLWHSHQRAVAQRVLLDEDRSLDQIAGLLASASPADLRAAGAKLRAAPDSPRSQRRIAEYALVHAALSAVFADGDAAAVRDAQRRAQAAHVPAARTAFADIVVPMLDGKLDAATSAVNQTAALGRQSAVHQLFAGVALERSGDVAALARYKAAAELDPKLVLAHVQAARLALLDGKPKDASAASGEFNRLEHTGSISSVLTALEWATKRRSDEPAWTPPTATELEMLPKTLRATPALVEAFRAARAGSTERAGAALDVALTRADGPFELRRLGMIALDVRDSARVGRIADALEQAGDGRKAALLRARDALANARFDDAERLTTPLGEDPEASLIRAMIAYEKWDIGGVESALRGMKTGADSPREFGALAAAANVLTRAIDPDEQQLQSLVQSEVPWADLLIVDAAMNSGRFIAAAEVMARWPAERMTAPELLRTARLRRYQGRLAESLRATEQALRIGDPTAAVVLERLYALLETGQRTEANAVLSKYAQALTPKLLPWAQALVAAYAQNPNRASVAQLSLPQGTEPLVVRILAGRVVSKMQDPRAARYVDSLQQLAPQHPDVLAARELASQ